MYIYSRTISIWLARLYRGTELMEWLYIKEDLLDWLIKCSLSISTKIVISSSGTWMLQHSQFGADTLKESWQTRCFNLYWSIERTWAIILATECRTKSDGITRLDAFTSKNEVKQAIDKVQHSFIMKVWRYNGTKDIPTHNKGNLQHIKSQPQIKWREKSNNTNKMWKSQS